MARFQFLNPKTQVEHSSTERLVRDNNGHTTETEKPYTADQTYWKPSFLSGTTAISFAGIFLASIIGLAVLYTQSKTHHGIAKTHENLHYLWTYGPTGFFTVVFAHWSLLEYQAKLLAPWRTMASNASPARSTIFLDLISPWNVFVLPRVAKLKLHVPFLAIVGSLLIRLMIIISTGLFVSQTVNITQSGHPIRLERQITNISYYNSDSDGQTARVTTAIDQYALADPLGTYEGYAFPTIDTGSQPPDAVVTFDADVFTADMHCDLAAERFLYRTTNVTKHGYPATGTTLKDPKTGILFTYVHDFDGGDPSIKATFPGCDNSELFFMDFPEQEQLQDSITSRHGTNVMDSYPYRCKRGGPADSIVLLAHDYPSPLKSAFLMKFTTMQCQPRFSMRRLPISLRKNKLTNDTIHRIGNPSEGVPSSLLANISVWDIYEAVNPRFQSPCPHDLLSGNSTMDYFCRRFKMGAAQLARTNFMASSGGIIPGQITVQQERLVVREFPFVFIQVLLGLLTCVCLALWSLSRHNLCPRNPGSIGGLATILARSPLMMSFFAGTSTMPLEELTAANSKTSYQTATTEIEHGASFGIIPSGDMEMSRLTPDDNSPDLSKWWQPIIVWTSSKIMVAFLTVALIITLEVLNKYSITNNGIVTIEDGKYISYSWVYIPTLTMMLVNVMYGVLDSTAVLFEPYNALRRGGSFTGKTMLEDIAGMIAPRALITCLSKRRLTVPATKLAIMAGSILSIAVSGLYTTKSIGFDKSVPLLMKTYPQKEISDTNRTEVEINNLPAILVYDHTPYPPWTYEEFSLFHVSFVNNDTEHLPGNITHIRARVPAQRGVMNCTMFEGGYDMEGPSKPDENPHILDTSISTVTPKSPPAGCDVQVKISVGSGTINKTGPWYYSSIVNYNKRVAYQDQHPRCPTWVMYVGLLSSDYQNSGLSMAHCTPYTEELEVEVTFRDSNFTIDPDYPPKAVPGTNKVVGRNVTFSPSVFQDLFASGTGFSNNEIKVPTGYVWTMDFFFNAIVSNNMVSSPADLMGPENGNRLIEKAGYLYSIAAAQLLNEGVEKTISTTTESPSKEQHRNGMMRQEKLRLMQSPISTHILTGLLGFMLICAVTAYATLRTRGVLPNDPSSIAAKMSLLAGSKMMEEDGGIAPGSEWLSDEQLRMNGTFAGDRFRLKWWGKRYGIDVESDDEDTIVVTHR